MTGRTVELEARYPDGEQTQIQRYTLDLVRVPTLSALQVQADGVTLPLDFDPETLSYAVATTASTVTVTATAFGSSGYRVQVNGGGATAQVPVGQGECAGGARQRPEPNLCHSTGKTHSGYRDGSLLRQPSPVQCRRGGCSGRHRRTGRGHIPADPRGGICLRHHSRGILPRHCRVYGSRWADRGSCCTPAGGLARLTPGGQRHYRPKASGRPLFAGAGLLPGCPCLPVSV